MTNKAISTGVLTSSQTVATGKNYLAGLVVHADGTNVATVNVYDNTAASGTKLLSAIVKAGERQVVVFPHVSIQASSGLYVELSGTGAGATVIFGA